MARPSTLIASYTPRGERSNTEKVLARFRSGIRDSQTTELDLARQVPDMFLDENLSAYIRRDYLGEKPGPEQERLLSRMDSMVGQVKSSDIVVVAFPMFNFSMPAVVKAWFDSIMLKNHTWTVENGTYAGLMRGRKALTIVTSGGPYGAEPMKSREHALSLSSAEFQFMGFDEVRGVLADGMNMGDGARSESLARAFAEVDRIAEEWYGR